MYGLEAVILDGTTLTGCKGFSVAQRERHTSLGTDGTVHQTFHAAARKAPKVDFTTVAVKQLLAALTTSLEVPMKTIATAVDFNFSRQDDAKPGKNATGHTGSRITSGHVYANAFRWAPGGDGLEASVEVFGLSANGTTDPITGITPTLVTPTPAEVFTLTSLNLGGQSITKCSSLELAIAHQGENNDESLCYNLGLPMPTMMRVAGASGPVEISASIETLDQVVAPTTSGTLVAVFTALAFGGTLGSATVTLTLNAAMIREDTKAAQQGSPGTRRFAIKARHDGTNRPLTWATT